MLLYLIVYHWIVVFELIQEFQINISHIENKMNFCYLIENIGHTKMKNSCVDSTD